MVGITEFVEIFVDITCCETEEEIGHCVLIRSFSGNPVSVFGHLDETTHVPPVIDSVFAEVVGGDEDEDTEAASTIFD